MRRARAVWLVVPALLFAAGAQAQFKTGSNPTTLATGANLQVEAQDGSQFIVTKDAGRVGVNLPAGSSAASVQNSLHIVHGTANNSGLRLTRLPNAAALASNASGVVVGAEAIKNSCTCGDVRPSFKSANYDNWVLMNGQALSGAWAACASAIGLSATVPNAQDRVLKQATPLASGGSMSVQLSQANLPNVNLSGVLASAGAHAHTLDANNFTHDHGTGGDGAFLVTGIGGGNVQSGASFMRKNTTATGGAHNHGTSSSTGGHGHDFTVATGGSGQAIDITPPFLSVNHFICMQAP